MYGSGCGPHGSGWGRGGSWGGGAPWGSGPPPWVQGLFGFGSGFGHSKGPKVRRGDVRSAILDVLTEEPANGYQVIQRIADRTQGGWKPSPGSVYPTLQQLEDEGLVTTSEHEGRREMELTETGRRYVADHAEELAATWRPFDDADSDNDDLKPVVGQVLAACWQVMTTGSREQQEEATAVLSDTRRQLYGLLAEGDPQ